MPHALITVNSEDKLNLFNVITVDNKTPIGIVKTTTPGRVNQTIKNATLNGIPNFAICLIKVIKVSEANIIVVKTNTPIKNISIPCLIIYLSRIGMLSYFSFNFEIYPLNILPILIET